MIALRRRRGTVFFASALAKLESILLGLVDESG